MKRDVRLYARTTPAMREKLESFARRRGLSLSSAIHLVLTDVLEGRYMSGRKVEKRRYERKSLSVPALVKPVESPADRPERATIQDLSVGGMRLSMSRDSMMAGRDLGNGCQFEAAFLLPQVRIPIRILCRRERAVASGSDLTIGATFIDADFERYRHIEHYLHQGN